MFTKLHFFRQDAACQDDFRWRPHSYVRIADNVAKGPATFKWSKRQLRDLEALWLERDSEGARDRLAGDLARFGEKLGWTTDAESLGEAEKRGEELLVSVSSAAPELYVLPWEVTRSSGSDIYLADYSGVLLRYTVPELGPRSLLDAPPQPGVLFGWSAAGGPVPHDDHREAICAAAQDAGVGFRELAAIDQASLEAALDEEPLSVLHLLCHGLPGPGGEPPRLKWGVAEKPAEVTATRLARMLHRHVDSIRLVVLSACGSGDGQGDALFMSSLAQELHKKGIPNVVASRYPLSVRGSRVMVQALYDKLLRQAWSLERALRHTRATLFRADSHGRSHPGDAYGIQLYGHAKERFVSDNGLEAMRPVLASYPFGSAAQPTPTHRPPRQVTRIELDTDTESVESSEDSLRRVTRALRRRSEDHSLEYKIAGVAAAMLIINTTVDGAQRLLAAWRDGALQQDMGLGIASITASSSMVAVPAASSSAAIPVAIEEVEVSRQIVVAHGLKLKSMSAAKFLSFSALLGAAVAALTMLLQPADPPPSPESESQYGRRGAGSETLPEKPRRFRDLLEDSAAHSGPIAEKLTSITPDDISAANIAASGVADRLGDDRFGDNEAAARPGERGPSTESDTPPKRSSPARSAKKRARQNLDADAPGAIEESVASGFGQDGRFAPKGAGAAVAADREGSGGFDGSEGSDDSAGSEGSEGSAGSDDFDGSEDGDDSEEGESVAGDAPPSTPAASRPRSAARPSSPTSAERQERVPRIEVNMSNAVKYDPQRELVQIKWRVPPGAAGVLVVTSKEGPVRGQPKPGAKYAEKGRWPGDPNAVISVFGRRNAGSWPLREGQKMHLSLWAYDASGVYSKSRTFKCEQLPLADPIAAGQ